MHLNALFRSIAAESSRRGVLIEGRDITTVVAPDAPARVLLTAHPDIRAARRAAELGDDATTVAEAMAKRDASDATVADFMTAAPGVSVVDTSDLTFDESVSAVLAVIQQAAENVGDFDGR